MDSSPPVPGFGTTAYDYGERAPDPPAHHHVGPWAVYQAFEAWRYTREDRARAALVMRFLNMDPATPRAQLVALGRRALAVVLTARLLGHAPDDVTLYVQVVGGRPRQDEAETLREPDE